jgi:hypothetical protein
MFKLIKALFTGRELGSIKHYTETVIDHLSCVIVSVTFATYNDHDRFNYHSFLATY